MLENLEAPRTLSKAMKGDVDICLSLRHDSRFVSILVIRGQTSVTRTSTELTIEPNDEITTQPCSGETGGQELRPDRTEWSSRLIDQSKPDRSNGHIGSVGRTGLAKDVLDVLLHGFDADPQ